MLLKLNFCQLNKYLSLKKLSDDEYFQKCDRELLNFFVKIWKIKSQPQFNLSFNDQIKINCLKFQDVDKEKYLIGKGGFGRVYRNKMQGNKIAIKLRLLNKNKTKDIANVVSEYYLTKNISHSYIIETYGYIKYNNQIGIVLEYCESGNLGNLLKNLPSGHPLNNFEDKIQLLIKIAQSIYYLHSRNYVHFDMKPHNIFLTNDLTPKIADFGLSKIIQTKEDKKASGCTIFYSPPEQAMNDPSDQSSDI